MDKKLKWFYFNRGMGQPAGGATYADKVLGYSPIAYWKLDEASGSTAADSSGNGYDGAYTAATLADTTGPDGGNAVYFNGVNAWVNFYSAGLVAALDYSEITMMMWVKMDAARWTDSTNRQIMHLYQDASNEAYIRKMSTDNSLLVSYNQNGDIESQTFTDAGGNADWFHLAQVASVTGDAHKVFYNGLQIGVTRTSLGSGTWTTCSSSNPRVGARQDNAFDYLGWAAHVAFFGVLSDAAIADLATV